MAIRMDGKKIAAEIRGELKGRVEALKARGIEPCPGGDFGWRRSGKQDLCAEQKARVRGNWHSIPGNPASESVTEQELIEKIRELNEDRSVHAMLVQLPLPRQIDSLKVLDEIAPEKDADGFHVVNAGRLFTGRASVLPCTPAGCMELIHRAGVEVSGKTAVVVGRSNIVGKPMAQLLLNENATVTICHSRTRDLGEITRKADILVCAVGRAKMVTGEMVKPGACVIDVGMNRLENGKVVGDVDFESVDEVAGYLTPVPGGVGPMTIAMLMQNAILAAEKHG